MIKTVTFPHRKHLYKTGTFTMSLEWSMEFQKRFNDLFGNRVPTFIRDEVIRTIEPYVPRDTGYLAESVKMLTTIDEDGITFRWRGGPEGKERKYAVRQFYTNQGKSGGKRGKLWTIRFLNDGAGGLLGKMESEFKFTTTGVLR